MKKIVKRMGYFFLSNLAGVGIYLLMVIPIFIFARGLITDMTETSRNLVNILIYAFLTLGFIVPFYKLYFLENKDFRKLWRAEGANTQDRKQIMIKHLKLYGKQDLICLFIFTILLATLPLVDLSKVGLDFLITFFTFLFASFNFFYQLIPLPVLPALVWAIYIILVYIVCLWFTYKKWSKKEF